MSEQSRTRPARRNRRTEPEESGEPGRPDVFQYPRESSRHADALPDYAERVLEVAELIPPGRVMTYGDVAEWLEEGGPRQVGRVMSHYGGAVPWWRVVRADGVLLPGHEPEALGHYRVEGTPLREAGRTVGDGLPRLDMRRARWDGEPASDGNGPPDHREEPADGHV